MTLCDDCVAAERDPLHAIFTLSLCCRARMVANTPRSRMAAAYAAAISRLDDAQAAALRDRAYEILKSGKVAQ